MSTRHLFLPFLIALAGIVSCNQWLPDDQQVTTRGYVTVDKQHYCNLLTLAMIHPTCLHLCTKLLSKARKGDAIHPEKSALFTIY